MIDSRSRLLPARQQAFTLVELMVALALGLFLVGGVILMHQSGRAASIDSAQLSRIQENVRFASDYLIRDIRNAGFRDETFLRTGHEEQIRQQYARIDGGNVLQIRYAGRGHCAQAFDEFRLIENEYRYNAATGELSCRGRAVPRDAPGTTQITAQSWSPAVGLVAGLTGIGFQLICPDGGSACPCDLINDFDNSCIGVRVGLQFRGLRELDGSGNFGDRSVELTAAFRNVILDRANAAAFPP